jgi:DNA-binding XRE family transcriptional regulator
MEYAIRNNQRKASRMCARKVQTKLDTRAIGLRIRQLRGHATQIEFAAHLEISQGQLSKIESGALVPSLEVLVRVAALYRKSIDWIVIGG